MKRMDFDLKRAVVTLIMKDKKTDYIKDQAKIAELKTLMEGFELKSDDWDDYRRQISDIRYINKHKEIIYCTIKIDLKHWSKYSHTFHNIKIENPEIKPIELLKAFQKYIAKTIKLQRSENKIQGSHIEFLYDTELKYSGRRGTKKGRVLVEPEQILKAYIRKNMKNLYTEKRPTTINRYIGIELEFCAPISQETMAYKLFKAGFHKYIQLKEDRSLRPKETELGFEIAMLLKETSYKRDLKKVLDFLTSIKAVTEDRRCGLHVHFDMRKRDKNIVYNNLVSCQTVLTKLVDPRRFNGEFCRLVDSKAFPVKFNGTREERYKTINAAAYYRHKTIEVRMHEGSIDFKSIVSWTDTLLKVVNYPKKIKSDISQLTVFQKRFKLNKAMYQTVVDKSCFWQVNHADLVRENDNRMTGWGQTVTDMLRGLTNPIPTPMVFNEENVPRTMEPPLTDNEFRAMVAATARLPDVETNINEDDVEFE